MASAIIKKGRATQRLYFTVTSGTGLMDLTDKTVVIKMAMSDETNPQTLATTIILPQEGADLGARLCGYYICQSFRPG